MPLSPLSQSQPGRRWGYHLRLAGAAALVASLAAVSQATWAQTGTQPAAPATEAAPPPSALKPAGPPGSITPVPTTTPPATDKAKAAATPAKSAPAASAGEPELPTEQSEPALEPTPGVDVFPDLAPASFASPVPQGDRVDDLAGWLSPAQRDSLIQKLDELAVAHGISIYISTAPAGQGPEVLRQARKRISREYDSGAVALYVLSSDNREPLLQDSSPRVHERLGSENFLNMNDKARQAITRETVPASRLAAFLKTLANELTAAFIRVSIDPQELNARDDRPATSGDATGAAASGAGAPATAPPPGSSFPVSSPGGTGATSPSTPPPTAADSPPPADAKEPAASPPEGVAPETEATEPSAALDGDEGRPYLWVALACLGALAIVGGGAWFLLNLYRPVEVTPRAATRVQEQKRQEELVRSRIGAERKGTVAKVAGMADSIITGARPNGEGNRRSPAQEHLPLPRQTAAPVAAPAPARRAPGETFEQRLWRTFSDFTRMHYGRRPEAFTPEQVASAQQHELFAALEEYLTYFKWVSSQANSRGDERARNLADERHQFLNGATNLLKRSSPALRTHLLGGLEAFLKECAEDGAVPGMAKQRKPTTSDIVA